MIDEGVKPDGFQVMCQSGQASLDCKVTGTSVVNRTVLFSYSDVSVDQDLTFMVSYSYKLCENSPATATLRG